MNPSSPWTPLHALLHTTLGQKQLLPRAGSILIAVSGGQDSLCLLKLITDLQPKWHWQIAVAHCDHRWVSDAGIASHVRQIAQDWQIPFYLQVAPPMTETEASARRWRYQALAQIATQENFSFVITGHTKSDRAETLLYNLIRGAGADGLAALTWRRQLTPHITLVRPLLEISRKETGQFCQQLHLPVWQDQVNENLKYARNRIRQRLIPLLQEEFNPQVETSLAQTAELLRADVAYLEDRARVLLQGCLTTEGNRFNRLPLQGVSLALQRRVMRQFWHIRIAQAPNFTQIEALCHLITAPQRSRTSSFPGNIFAEVRGDYIIFNPSND